MSVMYVITSFNAKTHSINKAKFNGAFFDVNVNVNRELGERRIMKYIFTALHAFINSHLTPF